MSNSKGRVSRVTMAGIVIGDFYEPDRASMVRAHIHREQSP